VSDAVKDHRRRRQHHLRSPAFAADAIMEAAEAGIKVIVCITEGIPVKDMVAAREYIVARTAA
jgi:succinyl-CoA synthetase alpha subunit